MYLGTPSYLNNLEDGKNKEGCVVKRQGRLHDPNDEHWMGIVCKSHARPKEGWILAVRQLVRYLTGSEQVSLFGSYEGRTDRRTNRQTHKTQGRYRYKYRYRLAKESSQQTGSSLVTEIHHQLRNNNNDGWPHIKTESEIREKSVKK